MATFDDFQALNSMFAQNMAPINRLGAGQLAIAQNELLRRQALEDEASKNLFTEQLLAQNHQFQTSQAEAYRRAQMGLQQNSQQFQTGRDTALFQQQQTGIAMDEARRLRAELENLGGAAPVNASTFEMRNAIQDRLGQGVNALMQQIAPLGKDIMTEGNHDPAKMERRIQTEVAGDVSFQKALQDYPDILKGLVSGSLNLKDVPAMLAKPAPWMSRTGNWYDSDQDKKQRDAAFWQAVIRAQNKIVDEETNAAMKGDFRKSPGYLEKLSKYKALNEQAHGLLSRLQNPDRIRESLNFMSPTASGSPGAGAPDSGGNFNLPPDDADIARQLTNSHGASASWDEPVQIPIPAKVKNIITTAPGGLKDFIPTWARNQLGGRPNPMSEQQAVAALEQYKANLKAEIARLLALGPRQRGISSRIAPLQAELARISQ